MQLLEGKPVAEHIYTSLMHQGADFKVHYGYAPCLAVVLVGSDPASISYVTSKQNACDRLGFAHRDYHYDETISQNELLSLITRLNDDPQVHGILVQLPLPSHIDEHAVINTISPAKDVDGFHPENVGKLLIGEPALVSCTPLGIIEMLDFYGLQTSGKHVVIVGRSNIVGKPMASLLIQKGRDATVTLCHSRTEDLGSLTRQADILIAAIGRPAFIDASMVTEGCIVIDVGINRIEDTSRSRGYRLVGDVDFESVAPKSSAITPVPGGVGVMTIAMLMKNTLQAASALGEEDV